MADLTKKRWLILGLCCLINLCIGSVYAWSVFATPLAELISDGFVPEGWTPPAQIASSTVRDRSWKEMLSSARSFRRSTEPGTTYIDKAEENPNAGRLSIPYKEENL